MCARAGRPGTVVSAAMSPVREAAHKLSGIPGAVTALGHGRLPVRNRGAAVLCYHDLGVDPTNRTDYYLGPDLFRDHLEWIRRWGLTIVPLAEIVDRHARGRDLDGLVAITFDDALAGVLEHAAPLLEAHRAPATVFVVTGVLGIDPPFWPGAARTLRPDEIRELCASGLVTLGSHTTTHASLPDVDPAVRERELDESRAWLEELTGTEIDLFAYPFGHHDPASEAATVRAGYRAACTFTFGRVTPGTPAAAMPRFCIGPMHDKLRLARQLARAAHAW
jgi:peptidoglycan/xylan/chitin deacetylase (PgdA/CDA1 family)